MDLTFKGTPGPWKIGKHTSQVVAINLPDNSQYDRNKITDMDYYGGYLIAESIEEDNAALIAAAPDLLQALIDIMPHATIIINENHLHYKNAISAITKALNIK